MPTIDSPQNQQVKLYRSLLSKKGRQKAGLCPLEGVRLIDSALQNGADLQTVYVCPELLTDQRGQELLREIRDRDIAVLELSPRAFSSMTDTQHPQGIAATAPAQYHSLQSLSKPGPAVYLWLYEIREPGNLGTIFRTAAAFDVAGIVLLGNCADVYNPKAIRASSGAIFAVPAAQATWDEAMTWADQGDIHTVAAALCAETSCHEAGYPDRLAAVIGSEAHGLPEHVLTSAQLQVKIPVSDKVESLNAGVATGILLYEIYRQRY